VPIVAPTFVKTRANLGEMEAWYDAWLRAVGSAVIVGPSDYLGLIDDVSVGGMSPPARAPCRRIASRMTILSDGMIVSCDQDAAGRRAMGNVAADDIEETWRDSFGRLRTLHGDRRWNECELCRGCREWHRP
jgi:radical SAM protein with 4Fe4S-binding SPASM domain